MSMAVGHFVPLSLTDRTQVSWKIVIKHLTNCSINTDINKLFISLN